MLLQYSVIMTLITDSVKLPQIMDITTVSCFEIIFTTTVMNCAAFIAIGSPLICLSISTYMWSHDISYVVE
jgi:hypothetical protein